MSQSKHRWLRVIILVCGLVLPGFALEEAQAQQPAILQSSDETTLRALVTEFFTTITKKDLDGFTRLWSMKSPDFTARKQEMQKLFAEQEKIEVKGLTIRKVTVDGEKAQARVEVELIAVEAKTGKPAASFGKRNRTLHCVKEEGMWKVWREASAEEELAAALVAAKTEEERNALLAEGKELMTGELAQALFTEGNRLRVQGDYLQALTIYRLAQVIAEQIGDKAGIARTLTGIGVVHRLQGNYAQSLEYYQKSLAMWESTGDKKGIADSLCRIGDIYEKQGRHSQALDYSERAIVLARQISAADTLRRALFNSGVAYRALNQFAKARQAFGEAIATIETLRAQIAGGEQEEQRYFESKVSPYHAMVDLLIAENHPAEALTFAERAKARVLLDVLQSGRINVTKAMTGEEQEKERNLNGQLVSLNTQVYRETARPQPDQARLTDLNAQLQKARLDFEAFQTNLYAAHPELRAQRGEAQPLRPEEAAALLPDEKSALLEYVVADDKTYLIAVTKAAGKGEAEVRAYTAPIKRAALRSQIEAFRRQLAERDLGFRASATKLYELLLKPAKTQLQGKTNLIISPDDKLWEAPFQALLTRPNRFLIEDAAIAYAPSLTVLREMMKRRGNQNADGASTTLLALGNPMLDRAMIEQAEAPLRGAKLDPLPEAEDEVKALGRYYGAARSKVYVGAEAREDRAKAEAGQARILHLATHGTLNNAAPMYSHLVLAPGAKNEDGLLEAWELMQMDLKAELVVLSACETARGRYGEGEGVIGLTWALFVAGAPATIVSQWNVESASTRDLMLSFHRHLRAPSKAEMTKAEALRQAALRLLKSAETSHPFYWAGFVLVGDGR